MNTRNLTAVVLIPLIVLVSVTPAHAIFGSILAGIQRAQMIVNQGIQITNQVRQITTMGGQLTELKDQFRHLKDQALGSVGALTQSFSDLASVPSALVSDGMGWKNDFTGEALGLVNAVEEMGNSGKSFTQSWRSKLQQADRVGEQDILGLFADHPATLGARAAENYRNARERGDKRLVLDHALSDAAAELTDAVRSALDSYDGLRNNVNTSNTALQQAAVAGQVTEGQLIAAMAQLMAYQAAREAAEDYEKEIRRRERLAQWKASQEQANQDLEVRLAAIEANAGNLREGLTFKIHPFYGGFEN